MRPEQKQIYLAIPEGTPWPVEGRDETSGGVILLVGFVDAVERASGMPPGTITQDQIAALLVAWYIERRKAGAPADPVMDELAAEELGHPLTITPDPPMDPH